MGCQVACAHGFCIPGLSGLIVFTCSAFSIWLRCDSGGLLHVGDDLVMRYVFGNAM